ncbi:unnamed protein product [Gongylonema pulchrum]|uniref:NR LBD domain-containing protein n=1 Tax=Gongylonema pulchrum TaxID=637853 RepID=A0A183DRN3_9BILA|nr:unnamed protein product [Gongylonema pulchrum]
MEVSQNEAFPATEPADDTCCTGDIEIMALGIAEAQQEFLKLLDRVEPRSVAEFLDWISESFVVAKSPEELGLLYRLRALALWLFSCAAFASDFGEKGNFSGAVDMGNGAIVYGGQTAHIAECEVLLKKIAMDIRSEVPFDSLFFLHKQGPPVAGGKKLPKA